MALPTVLIALVPPTALRLGLVGTFLGGFMNPITNGMAFALRQTIVAPEMQERVLTVAVSPIGMAVAGMTADAWGVRVWTMTGGAGPALLMLDAFFAPCIMYLVSGGKPAHTVTSEGAAQP